MDCLPGTKEERAYRARVSRTEVSETFERFVEIVGEDDGAGETTEFSFSDLVALWFLVLLFEKSQIVPNFV